MIDDQRWRRVRSAATDGDLWARVVVGVRQHSVALVDDAVARIVAAVPAYGASVAREDLWWSVHRNLELNLLLLAEHRPVTASELASRAGLVQRRAAASVDVLDLLRAFRIGYVCMWERLSAAARSLGPEAVEVLLDGAPHVWAVLDQVCGALEQAHRDLVAVQAESTERWGSALVGALRALPESSAAEAERAARALLLDPAGEFVVAVASGAGSARPVSMPGVVVVAEPDRVVAVAQGPSAGDLGELLARHELTRVGAGVVRLGLEGAALSLADAERAWRLSVSSGGGLVSFGDRWFECLVSESSASLAGLVGPLVAAVRSSESLASTLRALVEANGNMTAAAAALYVHPNTVAYRLRRLLSVSGVDVRTPDGLLRARLALVLAASGASS